MTSVADLVTRAHDGDASAWDELVERHLGLVHAICRCHGLGGDDAAGVNQVVWLRLVEHLPRLRAPGAVGGWVAATARIECLRVLRSAGWAAEDGSAVDDRGVGDPGIDAGLLVYERDRALLSAFAGLGEPCRRLLRLTATDPAASDDEVAAALDTPVGGVGPARAGCLAELQGRMA